MPESYPFQPVKMKFITKVYHPNVSSASGAICLDILKDAWSPVLTLKSTLISLQSLLCSPEPKDPQDAEVAKHYMTSRESFNETAKYWAQIYAGAPGGKGKGEAKEPGKEEGVAELSESSRAIALAGLSEEHVNKFVDMGFGFSKVVRSFILFCFIQKKLTFYTGGNARSDELSWRECKKYNERTSRGEVTRIRCTLYGKTFVYQELFHQIGRLLRYIYTSL